jgi:hypothetical protein
MNRKRFTTKTYEDLWEQHAHKCWRCGLLLERPLLAGKDWVWGHIVALGCGGRDEPKNVAPECRGCNETDNRTHATPMAAKAKRIRAGVLGVPKPESQWKRFKRIRAERAMKDDGHE